MGNRKRPLEGVVTVSAPRIGDVFAGTRVLLTGHTGFKGSWLACWLLDLGAEVTGYALAPDTTPNLFGALGLAGHLDSRIADVRDTDALARVVAAVRPEIVFHLAAQPLVRRSYAEPSYTLDVNVMGTANLLEAVRSCDATRVVLNVTTDKVYANAGTGVPFAEGDPLGGHDVYSASKACSEMVTAAYRASFFGPDGHPAAVASARAGNVVGGGDWAADRIVPDIVRALSAGVPVVVRNPDSVRPWEHVIEPLAGYLAHAAHLREAGAASATALNFGPSTAWQYTVRDVVERAIAAWGGGSWEVPEFGTQPHEASVLKLDTHRAAEVLGWKPVWGFEETIDRTIAWYRRYDEDPASAEALCREDISAYSAVSGVI